MKLNEIPKHPVLVFRSKAYLPIGTVPNDGYFKETTVELLSSNHENSSCSKYVLQPCCWKEIVSLFSVYYFVGKFAYICINNTWWNRMYYFVLKRHLNFKPLIWRHIHLKKIILIWDCVNWKSHNYITSETATALRTGCNFGTGCWNC